MATIIRGTKSRQRSRQEIGDCPGWPYDPQIKADLERFGRSGVPMYVIFPANKPDAPILLDEILTPGAVIEGLRRAGPSETPTRLSANAKRIIVWDRHLAGP